MNKDLEFIEYTGVYPVLCQGLLFIRLKGQVISFGEDYHTSKAKYAKNTPNYPIFWESGGRCNNKKGSVSQGPWKLKSNLDLMQYPEEVSDYLLDILELFNQNVKEGCCGGCL